MQEHTPQVVPIHTTDEKEREGMKHEPNHGADEDECQKMQRSPDLTSLPSGNLRGDQGHSGRLAQATKPVRGSLISPNERRHGRCVILWTDDGRPLDRWERDVDQVREHAAFVQEKIEKLRALVVECDEVLLGRETGPGFWSRFDVNIAVLERVVDRDRRWARVLDEAAAREAQQRP